MIMDSSAVSIEDEVVPEKIRVSEHKSKRKKTPVTFKNFFNRAWWKLRGGNDPTSGPDGIAGEKTGPSYRSKVLF